MKKEKLNIEQIFLLGLESHKKNDLKSAEKFYNDVLDINPNHFNSIFYLASLSAQTKNYIKAKNLFEKIIQIKPNYDVAYANLGAVLKELGKFNEAVEACRKATKKPLITKLSPNQTDIAENAKCCIESGTDGFAVINTMTGMAIDIEKRKPIIDNNQGGLSGPAIKPIALLKVHQVYEVAKQYNIPIIGQGGIRTIEDAIEFIIAGSTAVGIGTALFYEPLVCSKLNQGIIEYLDKNNLNSISELIGTLKLNS